MSDTRQTKKGCGWMQVLLGAVCLLFIVGAMMPLFCIVPDKANQAATAAYCRSIIAVLKLYADDHGGVYPDAGSDVQPTTSNDAFQILIKEGILEDERVFGAKSTKYQPDNNIGQPPKYKEALEAGENHWAMTKGLTTKSNPRAPLVFENPVAAGWPPIWNCDAAGKKEKGRAWRGGKIVVGFNDGSAEAIQLESAKGSHGGPKPDADGKNVFTRAGDPMDMLDILE